MDRKALPPLILACLLTLAGAARGDRADDQFAVAARHYREGQFELAAEEFDRFLNDFADDPRAADAGFFRAESLVQTANYSAAEEALRKFVAAHPTHRFARQALFRQGEIAHFRGRAEVAEPVLEAFCRQFPGDGLRAYGLVYLGEIALAGGRPADALSRFSASLAEFPGGPLLVESRFGAAQAMEQADQHVDALRFYELVAGDRASPLADDAQLRRGLLLIRAGNIEQAALVLDAFAGDGENGAGRFADSELAAEARFRLGDALEEAGRREDAADCYREIVAEANSAAEWSDDAAHRLFEMAFFDEEFQEASGLASEFERRFPGSPHLPRVRKLLARANYRMEDYAGAAELLESTASDAEADPADLLLLALCLAATEQHEAALAAIRQVEQQNPAEEISLAAISAKGASLAALKRFEEAIPPLAEYLRKHSEEPGAADQRGQLIVCLAATGRLDEAIIELERLRREAPSHHALLPATEFLAETALAKQRYEQALELSSRLAADGESGHILMKGKSLEALDRPREAVETYRLVYERFAESDEATTALWSAAVLLDGLQDDEEAARLYAELAAARPANVPRDELLYQWAWSLTDLGRDEQAEDVFAALAAEHRGSRFWGDAQYWLAQYAAGKQEHERSAALVAELLDAQVENGVRGHALYLQGQLAATLRQWEQVEPPLTTLLREQPQSPLRFAAEFWIAESLFRRCRFGEASIAFANLQAGSEANDSWLAIIPLRRAQILAQEKKWDEAYALAKGIPLRYPGFEQQFEVDYLLGRCLQSRANFDFDAARAAYGRVVESTSAGRTETAAMAQWMIGETYLHQRRHDEAILAYERVVALFDWPKWQALALLQAGNCRQATGEWRKAGETFERLLQEFPGSEVEDKAQIQLQRARRQARLAQPQ